MRVLLLLVLLVGCGSVASSELTSGDAGNVGGAGGHDDGKSDAGDAGGGTGGAVGGAGGRGGELGSSDAGGDLVGDLDARACVSNNAPGFSFGGTCDGGAPASAGCHASCSLAGDQYVGCVDPSAASSLAFYCYASCSACP